MKNITKYKLIYRVLELKKEYTKRYDIPDKINSPYDAFISVTKIFDLKLESEEIFVILALNTKNKIIGAFEVSRGILNSSLVHPREIFKRLMMLNSNSFILAHNHPSGNIKPSSEDLKVTTRLNECGLLLGIQPLDHIIVSHNDNYYSFKENNHL